MASKPDRPGSLRRSPVGCRQDLPNHPSHGNCQEITSEEKSPKLYPIARFDSSERMSQHPHFNDGDYRLRFSANPQARFDGLAIVRIGSFGITKTY